MKHSILIRSPAVLGLMLLLASCGGGNPFEVTISNCPAVAVVSFTGTVTKFAGFNRNVDDVEFNATITNLRVDCDERDDTGIYQRVSFNIIASKGPAYSGEEISLPYFALLLRDNNLITTKRIFNATLQFPANSDRAVVGQAITQTLPDLDIARRYDYELLIGFQLSPEEIAYNALR